MKKSVSQTRKPSSAAPKTVEEYLSCLPEPARGTLDKVRTIIRSVVPAETIEVISYGIPAFKSKKIVVWYAGFTEHWSLFPTASVIEQFRNELKGYGISKGTIQFPIDQSPPAPLVKKLVKARLAQLRG